MRFSSLPQLETSFLSNGNNGEYTLRKIAVPVPGENLTLKGMLCTPARRTGYFHAVESPKERILLHFTAGQIRSDMSALSRQDFHVSVPFVIGRNGTIYQLYSSRYWSGNIGKGIGNAGNAEDKKTIAIEISNYGVLKEKSGNLETIYSRLKDERGIVGPVDVYCTLQETEAYQKVAIPFRGESYYPTFTNEQYESLIILLRYLTATYKIPRQFLPENKRYVATNDVLNFKGIVSHVNYRESGKWDLGPAFDWARVMSGLQAASFQPSIATNRDLMADADVIRSEEEIENLVPATRGLEADSSGEEDQDIDSTAVIEAQMEAKAEKKSLYALIVGIDDYRADITLEGGVLFPKLSGCAGDAKKIASYVKGQPGFDLKVKTLYNEKATKEAIVDGFQKHLAKAKKGDTVLFYYSGHGTQEWADKEAWTSDGDGRLECLACYFDEESKGRFLLADKELRYLLKQLSETGAHIVALFDCCHSGDNTRNGAFAQSAFGAVERRIPFSFKQRDWNDFIFSKKISRNEVIKNGEATALPQGLHVQLSACESDESAVEVNGEGVFTKALINTLQSAKGDVTYQALRSRVRQYLRNVYEQKPRIYVVNGDESLLYSTFLNLGSGEKSLAFGDVLHNGKGWQLSLGAIHGIGESTKTIKVLDTENGNKEYEANIVSIKADTSSLTLPAGTKLDPEKVYKGYVENLLTTAIRICVNNVDGDAETQAVLMKALTDGANRFIILDEKEPQYVVNNYSGQLYITRPKDEYRPRVQPLEAVPESVPLLMAYLKQMAQWEHLQNLSNKGGDGNLTGNEIAVTIKAINGTETKEVSVKDNKASIEYQKEGDKWKTGLEINLKNTTDTSLYCAAIYLTSNFGAVNNLIPGMRKFLEPGESVKMELKGKAILPFSLGADAEWYNWEDQTEYLKLIVNTEEFDPASLSFDALPSAVIPGTSKEVKRSKAKGLDTDDAPDTEGLRGWGTQSLVLQQPNPAFNHIDEDKVKKMLEDEDTAVFALGIYFDAVESDAFKGSYKLKQEIQTKAVEKGIFGDLVLNIANSIARHKRNKLYKETIRKFPDRIRIVSEGDSWFQHPLVLDVIDHLSRTYAVYCAAAAGDTLRNIQSGDKTRGEYYLNAIDEAQPTFFLISGGGNDILGSQFRTYLKEKFDEAIEEGKEPKRFLTEEIFKEMEALADIYRSLFQSLQVSHPNLQIIVHGYDYPIKLNDAKKGWLGRYMIEKGIKRSGDRQAIIHAIMDEFNRRLKEVAVEFDNVSYLDLRGLVRFKPEEAVDQWYDEIHPNDEGFQQIAMKYIQKISEKTKKAMPV
jgi:N-acetyl-anhydromuramyl-L-alanine amidase AmpD/lysophospholipase L1-like esterase